MGAISTKANIVYADRRDGIALNPLKSEIRDLFKDVDQGVSQVETAIAAAQAADGDAAVAGGLAGAAAADAALDEKADVDGFNITDGDTFRSNIGAVASADLTRLAPKAAPLNNKIAFLGDSISFDGPNVAGSIKGNRGFCHWIPFLTKQRVVSSVSLVFGVSGNTATQVAARVGDVIASGAGICTVLAGTNDVGTNNFTTTTTALASIYQALTDANILVIAIPITARTLVNGADYAFVNAVNAWIAKQPQNYPNLRVIDNYLYGEPYSTTTSPRTDWSYDGLHPKAIGMRYIAQPIADYLNSILPFPPRSIRTVTDFVAANNPGGYTNNNPMIAGTGGTITSGGGTVTGTAPDGWSLFADAGGGTISSLTIAGSIDISATGLVCEKIAVGGSATGGYQTVFGLNQTGFTQTWQTGDRVQVVAEIEVIGGTIGLSGIGAYLGVTQGGVYSETWDGKPSVADDLTNDGYVGILVSEPLLITGTITGVSIGVWGFLKNSGTTRAATIKIVSIAARKVT